MPKNNQKETSSLELQDMKYLESQVDQVTKQIKNSRIKKLTVSTKYKVQSTKPQLAPKSIIAQCSWPQTKGQGSPPTTCAASRPNLLCSNQCHRSDEPSDHSNSNRQCLASEALRPTATCGCSCRNQGLKNPLDHGNREPNAQRHDYVAELIRRACAGSRMVVLWCSLQEQIGSKQLGA